MISAFNKLGTATTQATSTTTTTTVPKTTTTTLPPSEVSVQVLNGVNFTEPSPRTLRPSSSRPDSWSPCRQRAGYRSDHHPDPVRAGHEAAAQTLAGRITGATQLVVDPPPGQLGDLTVGTSFTG